MVSILVVAPGIHATWSEGRKNFVRDLIAVLRKHAEVRLFSTAFEETTEDERLDCAAYFVTSRYRSMQMLRFCAGLRTYLDGGASLPDILIHFPFGSFSGVRGRVNLHMIRTVDSVARQRSLPCITALYSVTDASMASLSSVASVIAAMPGEDWRGLPLNFGIDCGRFAYHPPPQDTRRLLFMAGHARNQRAALDDALYERGLIDIIHAGNALARQAYSLTIAIPLLRYPQRLKQLRTILRRFAPDLPVELIADAVIPDIFAGHSLYLFPYRKNLTRFTPTSILEAMASGIPVLVSDLPMLRHLGGSGHEYCESYTAGDSQALCDAVSQISMNWEGAMACAGMARQFAIDAWDIQVSAQQVMAFVNRALHINQGEVAQESGGGTS